jgi:Domain of unknown function (DUF4214)
MRRSLAVGLLVVAITVTGLATPAHADPIGSNTSVNVSAMPSHLNQSVLIRATVIGIDGSIPTDGSVQFSVDGNDLGAAALDSSGHASLVVNTIPVTACVPFPGPPPCLFSDFTLTASYGGSAIYADSTGSRQTLTFDYTGWFQGDASVAQFIDNNYVDLLGRTADGPGLEYWGTLIAGGTPLAAVSSAIAYGDEFHAGVVDGAYAAILGRPADPGGRSSWIAALRNGMSIEAFEGQLIGSDEFFFGVGGTVDEWIGALYETVLGRPPLPNEVSFIHGVFATGALRPRVAQSLLMSDESLNNVVGSWYDYFLLRTADAPGLDGWVLDIQAGIHDESVVANILGSDEYYSKVTGDYPTSLRQAAPAAPARMTKIAEIYQRALAHAGPVTTR